MELKDLKEGDLVLETGRSFEPENIVKITHVTPRYIHIGHRKYLKDGSEINHEKWESHRIKVITPETEEKFKRRKLYAEIVCIIDSFKLLDAEKIDSSVLEKVVEILKIIDKRKKVK